MSYPTTRLRRLRRTPALRRAFTETRLHPAQLVLPMFVKDGIDEPVPIGAMPGVVQHTRASAVEAAVEAHAAGVGGVILFGIPARKDDLGSGGWDPDGPVPGTTRAIKDRLGDDLVVWADVCQCEYTDHGHCGPLDRDGQVVNDAAVAGYVRDALAYAEAGVDLVAPSGMMDGQVGAIRHGLDVEGHARVGVVAYAAKYASAFYGPFREAAESSLRPPGGTEGEEGGDRASHQMDPGNRREARRELALDLEEGADVLMVKPAMPYLDVLVEARHAFDVPLAAYQVSGEHAMLAAAAANGWLDGDRVVVEAITSILRAGADQVLTYSAVDVARAVQG